MTSYLAFRNKFLPKSKLTPFEELIHKFLFDSKDELIEWKYVKYKL